MKRKELNDNPENFNLMKIGEPKTDLQKLVNHYLELKEINDYDALSKGYSRYVRPAKRLLGKLGLDDAKEILSKLAEAMKELKLSWEIETVMKQRWWNDLVCQLPKNTEQLKKLEEMRRVFIEGHCLSENKFNKFRTECDEEAARLQRRNR